MAPVHELKTLGRARLSFASQADIDEFVDVLERFERGELTSDQWRAFRLVRGTYGQRQAEDAQMLRVKVPQGVLTAPQLRELAEVAERYSRGFGHITTRQNIQLHFVKLHDAEPAMRRLAGVGLTTREACGNSVRNITACPYAGVSADEVFDPTPYAEAMTRYLLRHPLSSSLPRKFKIAFEGCADDHAATAIHDLGFRAQTRTERSSGTDERVERGFRVTAGGGTAILCRSGQVLYDFLPAGEILIVAEAVVRVFHELGDREHKQRNRMKFLIKTLGWDRWRREFERALDAVREEGGASLPFDPDAPPVEVAPTWTRRPAPDPQRLANKVAAGAVRAPGLLPEVRPVLQTVDEDHLRWLRTNVRPQKQTGYTVVTAAVPLGDLTGAQMRAIGDLASAYGDGVVRVTNRQDLVFRWVPTTDVEPLYRRLAAAGLALADANTIADVTSCPGAESCRLAVTQSRGLGRALEKHLRGRPELVATASTADIRVSGCPNGCGLHHIAAIGFQGSIRRVGGRAVPQYFVMAGGSVENGGAEFGPVVAKIPVRRAPDAVERLIALWSMEREPKEEPAAFFRRVGPDRLKPVLADLEHLDDLKPEDFVDLGETAAFAPVVMDGECSA